jgi:hypothetical protein
MEHPQQQGYPMPTYFEIVGETLDRSYVDIESPEKDKLITGRLAELSAQYAKLLVAGKLR